MQQSRQVMGVPLSYIQLNSFNEELSIDIGLIQNVCLILFQSFGDQTYRLDFFFFCFPFSSQSRATRSNLGRLLENLFNGFVLIIQCGQGWIPFQDVVVNSKEACPNKLAGILSPLTEVPFLNRMCTIRENYKIC